MPDRSSEASSIRREGLSEIAWAGQARGGVNTFFMGISAPPRYPKEAKNMKTNSSDVIRGGECVYAIISAPCRVCGRRPATHCPVSRIGAYCGRHCPACTATAALDVEAMAIAADRSAE